jgi:hypothetical protein
MSVNNIHSVNVVFKEVKREIGQVVPKCQPKDKSEKRI